MNRFSAFGIHLGISFVIFLALSYLVVFEWYPGIFFDTDGGWPGMRIITAVDLIMGPTLTLVVFKKGKPGLRMDLTLIGLFQLVCLSTGTYVVFSERPVAVVYTDGRFTVMSRDDYVEDAGVDVPHLRHFPGDDPKWVMLDMPDDLNEAHDLRARTYKSGRLLNSLTDYYVPFAIEDMPTFLSEAEETQVIRGQAIWRKRIDDWLGMAEGGEDDFAFFTFSTRYAFGYLVYDRDTVEQVGVITNMD
jgi:hypothetical protein